MNAQARNQIRARLCPVSISGLFGEEDDDRPQLRRCQSARSNREYPDPYAPRATIAIVITTATVVIVAAVIDIHHHRSL